MEANLNKTLTGLLTKYITEKNYGFIETEEGASYFFFHDRTGLTKKEVMSLHKFRNGDEVQFKIKEHAKHGLCCYDVVFVKNSRTDKIIEEAKELNILKGYLKKVEDKYFVKHVSTYCYIPVLISEWEADLDMIYDDRINNLVTFELQNLEKPYKISAILTDRVFKPEFALLTELKSLNQSTFATITGVTPEGYFCYLLHDTIRSFVGFYTSEHVQLRKLKKGDIVEVRITRINTETKHVQLSLVVAKEASETVTKRSFEFKKEHFGQTIVEKKKATLIERTHGIIVNNLAIELQNRNFDIGNDSNRDLIIHDGESKIKCIFEIKTSSATQSIYAAVGQLLIYSISIDTLESLFIVLPDLLKPTIIEKLKELQITPIYYSWHEGQPLFHNLDKALSVIKKSF